MEDLMSQIESLFRSESLIDADKLLDQLDASFPDHAKSELHDIIREDIKTANECLEWLGDLDSWNMVKETDNIATFSKGTSEHFTVRCEMIMEQPIFPVLSLASEIDLLKNWVPIMKDAVCLGQPTIFRRVIHYKFKIPWPVDDRDMLVSAVGIPVPENKSALIILRSIDHLQTFMGIELPPPEGTRITLKLGCLNIAQISENQTQISLIASCDTHMAVIPNHIVNYATKHGAYYFMEALRGQCENYQGSVFEERVNANPDYYREISERIEKNNQD